MIKRSDIIYLFLFFPLLFSGSCKKDNGNQDNYLDQPDCSSTYIPKAYDCQVVGFYPSWTEDIMPLQAIPWDKLTRLVYAFAIPNTDGTINTSDLVRTQQLADSAHAHGVEIYFSIGGGDGSNNFPVMATNVKSRSCRPSHTSNGFPSRSSRIQMPRNVCRASFTRIRGP